MTDAEREPIENAVGGTVCSHGHAVLVTHVSDGMPCSDYLLAVQSPQLGGWRPIETAPKDGSHLLLYRPVIQFVGYYATGSGMWCVNAPGLPMLDPPPTHWMPLPPAPEQGETDD